MGDVLDDRSYNDVEYSARSCAVQRQLFRQHIIELMAEVVRLQRSNDALAKANGVLRDLVAKDDV